MTIFKPMVVPLAQRSGKICTGQIILQPISLESDRLLAFPLFQLPHESRLSPECFKPEVSGMTVMG